MEIERFSGVYCFFSYEVWNLRNQLSQFRKGALLLVLGQGGPGIAGMLNKKVTGRGYY